MSVNFRRVTSKNCYSNREYKIKCWIIDPDPYPFSEYWNWYPRYRAGYTQRWWPKQILPYQVRMYRSWKYNRKTQWKP